MEGLTVVVWDMRIGLKWSLPVEKARYFQDCFSKIMLVNPERRSKVLKTLESPIKDKHS